MELSHVLFLPKQRKLILKAEKQWATKVASDDSYLRHSPSVVALKFDRSMIPLLISFNLAVKSGPESWNLKGRLLILNGVSDSGETVMELDAEVDADDVPFRSNNCLSPTRCCSCGVQNDCTRGWMCAYFLVLVADAWFGVVLLHFSALSLTGVRKFRASRR